ncbi:hypothetical protein GN958_ATG02164 [Phytophthora infestans]|uniref:Uncharacterized protein n=1 Tax=Phytophthora infestans TaxID=4787 RepID=A0A8S9VB96_PHYIN|nr:hypothetical protein GN958_ATG02164 [Phytophthora infestans]
MGWTSKVPPSRGIETRGKASGTVGVDFIHGEQAVVDYAMKSKGHPAIDRVCATAATKAATAQPPPTPEHHLSVHKPPTKKRSSSKFPARRSKSPARKLLTK